MADDPKRALMGGLDAVLRAGTLRLMLFRHGEAECNLRNRSTIGGRVHDSPLTARGRAQAASLGAHLRAEGVVFDRVYASPALRAVQTAEVALREAGQHAMASLVKKDDALQEIDQGEWQGRDRAGTMTSEVVRRIQADPWNHAAPGGESQKDVERRMLNFVDGTVVAEHRRVCGDRTGKDCPARTVGVFSHGMAIRCFLRGILASNPAMTWKVFLDNASVSELWLDPVVGWRLIRVNAVPKPLQPPPKL